MSYFTFFARQLFLFIDHDPIAERWQRVREKADEPDLFISGSSGTMGDTTRGGVELTSLYRNPFTIDVHFPTAFIYINKLIDLRVDMPAQEVSLTPDKNDLGAG
jgi:hypothetical protein